MLKRIILIIICIITVISLFISCRNKVNISTLDNGINIDIKEAQIDENQILGADMVSLDYASDEIVIFHGYFGLFVYSLSDSKLINSINLEAIGCNYNQGDNYCSVSVSHDGDIIQLHNVSSKDMYVYYVYENRLVKKEYEPLENNFKLIKTPEPLKETGYIYSTECVKFENGDIGYLRSNNWQIESLEYIRKNEKFKIFIE